MQALSTHTDCDCDRCWRATTFVFLGRSDATSPYVFVAIGPARMTTRISTMVAYAIREFALASADTITVNSATGVSVVSGNVMPENVAGELMRMNRDHGTRQALRATGPNTFVAGNIRLEFEYTGGPSTYHGNAPAPSSTA